MRNRSGDYFLDSILSDFDSLILFASVHPFYIGFHRMLSKRFPFGIYYEVEDEVVYVYAPWLNDELVMAVLLDSGFLFASLNASESEHQATIRVFEKIFANRLFTVPAEGM